MILGAGRTAFLSGRRREASGGRVERVRECESVVFVRCVGEDERGSGGGRVARLVFSPGPRVVETLTLPVSRALFFSLPESARRWEGPAGFLSGVPLRWRSRGGRSGLDRWRRFRWARHRVLRCLKYKGRVLGREREREGTATRVAGVWCERRTLVLCRAPAMRDARTLSSFSARLYSIDLYV